MRLITLLIHHSRIHSSLSLSLLSYKTLILKMHFFLFLSFFRSLSLSVCLSLDLSTSSVFLNLLSFFLLHSSVRCSSLSSPPQAVKLAANNFLDFVFFSRQKYSFHETPSQLSLSLSIYLFLSFLTFFISLSAYF